MLDRVRIFFHRMQQRLADLGDAMISPVEQVVSRTAGKVLSASEHVDRVGSLLTLVVRVILWPFRLVTNVSQALLPASVHRFFSTLAADLQDLVFRMGTGFLQLAEILNLDRVVFGLVWLLQPIWRPLASIGIFCFCWINTRQYRSALLALPAILLALLVLGVGTFQSVLGKSKIIAQYREAVLETQVSNDFLLRELCDQKLAQLGEDTQLTQYRTAIAHAEAGNLEEASMRMELLAPEDHAGYPNAHYWIVQHLINRELVDSHEESKRLIRVHLKHLESLDVQSPQLTFIEGVLLKRENKLEEAATLLKPIVQQIPGAAFERMVIDLSLNRPEQAQQDARAVVTHMKSLSRGDRKLKAVEYQQWTAAEEVLGNLRQMRTLLEEWYELEPESEQAAKLLANVCRRQAQQLLRAPLPDQAQIVELWLRAAQLDKSSDALLQLARALYAERESSPVYADLLTALHQSPNTPPGLLVAVGTEIAQYQQYKAARPFLAAAVGLDELNPVAWNNYGLVLSSGEDPQLEDALVAINKALEIMPKEHRFRETRGQILLKMERWQDAIDDLEYALNGLPELKEIHQSISVAYAALGQTELAELHQEQAD